MTRPRIYLPRIMEVGDHCTLTGEERHYVISVLRLASGDRVLLFDSHGHEYEAALLRHDSRNAYLSVVGKRALPEETPAIVLAQSLPKAMKMDGIVERACEMGVRTIVPFISERSIPRLSAEKAAARQGRWQKIAREAARKSHAAGLPEVRDILSFAETLHLAGKNAMKLIFWEEESRVTIRQVLRDDRHLVSHDFFLAVGPEGGFTEKEIALAASLGFISVSLGRQILKVETAVLAILAIVQYERGLFSSIGKGEGES